MSFLLVIGFLSLFAAGMADNIRGPLLPEIIRTMQIGDTEASLLFSVASAVAILGSFVAGPWLRRFGTLYCLRLLICTYVSGYLLISVAPTYAIVLIGSALYGIGMGSLHVVHNVIVSQESPPEKRNRHFSILHMMYGLASLGSPLIAMRANQFFGHWQAVFMLVTFLPMLLVVSSFFAKPKRPAAAVLKERLPFFKVIGLEPCRFYAFFLSFYAMAELLVSLWLVLYITRLGKYSPMEAAGFLTCFFVSMTVSRGLAALLLKNRWNRIILVVMAAAGIVSILFGIYQHPVWLVLFAFFAGPIFPVAMAELSNEIPHEVEAATGWVLTAIFVAISVSQTAMGWISEHFSILWAMHFPAAALGIALAGLLARHFTFRWKNLERFKIRQGGDLWKH